MRTGRIVADLSMPPDWFTEWLCTLSQKEVFSQKLPVIIAATGKSREYVSRLFFSVTGTTLLQYIQKKRVDLACRLLRNTDRSVLDISLDCGFDNLSTFYHIFKRYTNTAPKQYREAFLQREKAALAECPKDSAANPPPFEAESGLSAF